MTQVFTGPPTITLHPANHSITVSVIRVNLNCRGTGRGTITYQWETSNINGGQWMNISKNRKLVVRNLEQSQQYRCVVSNEAGSTRSNVATVEVLSKLLIYFGINILYLKTRDHHTSSQFYYCYSITRCHIKLFSIC